MSLAIGVRHYLIADQLTLPPGAAEQSTVDVWWPLLPDTPYQRVLDVSLDVPHAFSLGYDSEHGNAMLYLRVAGPTDDGARLHIRYLVERRPVPHVLDVTRVAPPCARPLFWQALQPERFVDVTPDTGELAREVAGGETNALAQARRIYDHVVGTMRYDAAQQSWKGSTEHALVCSIGNCNDIHALFISLCRSLGIPARLVMGQALEPPPPGQEHCELCGYHCWAEFFVGGLGWLPADASCACKYGKHELFGDLELNHIAWSVGRDILLHPPQRGERLLYFVAPYVEVDGQPHRAAERAITFAEH